MFLGTHGDYPSWACHSSPPPPLLVSSDPDLFLRTARLRRLPSSASDLASNDVASLRETTGDPFTEGCACQRDGLTVIVTACLTFATAVTVALIMQIYFGDPQVTDEGQSEVLSSLAGETVKVLTTRWKHRSFRQFPSDVFTLHYCRP